MAAGPGGRYGGLKQLEPVGPCGEISFLMNSPIRADRSTLFQEA